MKVKIEQRSVYHKFVELEIEIPDDIDEFDIQQYLNDNEDFWVDEIDHKLNETEFVSGTGLYDYPGHEDSEAEHEWRYECEELGIGGHL
jgi:hypothetical protein